MAFVTKYLPRLMMKMIKPSDALDDTHQMGGDIVLDKEGNVHFLHHTKTSFDRPAIEKLLRILDGET